MSALEPEQTQARTRVVLVGSRRLYLEAVALYLDSQPGISAAFDPSSREEMYPAGTAPQPADEGAQVEGPQVVLIDTPTRLDGEAVAVAAGDRYPGARLVLLVDGRDQRAEKHSDAAIGSLSTQMRASELAKALLHPSWRPAPRRQATGTGRREPLDSLSERESRVLQMMVAGSTAPEVAALLGISPHTVRTHVQNVMAKLGCRSRVEMIAVGRGAGPTAGASTWS